MKRQLVILGLAITVMAAQAQEENQLTIDAQLRTRGEYNNGAIRPRAEGELNSMFVNERARLSTGFKRQNLELKMSVQHTGVWGQDDIKDRDGRVAMNEAWAKMHFGDFFVQVGRQQLSYDDERILGGLDWNVAGNWHDALRAGYEQGAHKLHAVVALNQDAENNRGNYYDGPMPYKNMQTLWYHYKADDLPLGISLLGMNLGYENGQEGHGKNKYMQTVGTHITYQPQQIEASASFYYQMGENAAGTDVAAWMASGRLGYAFDPTLKLTLGYDYLSGNSGGNKVKAFNPLYGTHHKFYGSMDYFTGQVGCGLHDMQATVASNLSKKVSAQAAYHYFMAAQDVPGCKKKGLGHEVDLQFTAKVMKDVTLMGGYSFMLGTETVDALKGGNHKSWQDWAWVQLNISPRVFTTKWK